MDKDPKIVLLAAIDNALHFVEKGQRAKAEPLLRFTYDVVIQYPHILWDETQVWKIAKAFLIMYHYDMIEDEDKNFDLISMSFVFTQRTIDLFQIRENSNDNEDYFQALHTQVVLLHSCADCFIGEITQLYANHKSMSNDEIIVSERLARKVLPYVIYKNLVQIDDAFVDFNGNKFLSDLCNTIELENEDLSEKHMKEANRMHKILHHNFSNKFKKIIS